jgi:4-hydroxyphenylacetate decarboxylase small subunit
MTTTHHHRDCQNFAAIDVAKGICHRTKELVQADAEQCPGCVPLRKCANCNQFSATSGVIGMGVCGASKAEPKFFAYPDMVATTCELYQPH